MKKLDLIKLFSLGILTLSFASCSSKNPYEDDPRYDIYVLATQSGFEGTNEEWLLSIRGEDGEPGETPYIGENGNWWIGDADTGVSATGNERPQGVPGKDRREKGRED